MLRYSYKTVLKGLMADKAGLLINLQKKPNNERILRLLKNVEQEIVWYYKRIKDGTDFGCRIT